MCCLPIIALCLVPSGAIAADDAAPFPVTIQVDAAKTRGELTPIWRFFGYDEPNFSYMKDGRKLLAELGQLGPTQVFVRTHHLLTSGDGTPALKWGSTNVYREDVDGNPHYDWTIVDRIFDTYIERGLEPYVQIGFMPKDLSTRPDLYPTEWPAGKLTPIDRGQAYPPKDYAKWGELCFQWTRHCVEKYGKAVAERWWWEVWNEPNISYWKGTPEEFYKLYDYAADGVRRAAPTARIGGPETAGGPGGKFLENFIEHCLRGTNAVTGQRGTALDFVSFHAKGAPKFVDGHVRMGVSNQLNDIDRAFAVIARFPELKERPVIIGESDPEGCAACRGPQNGYRNGTMYSSYTAAIFARKYELADKYGVNFQGALTWAFEFENEPYFAGFRVLASNGIDHPVLNVFRMFGKMGGRRLALESSAGVEVEEMRRNGVRAQPDVSALASLDGNKLCILVWHYHDDDLPGPDATVQLSVSGLPMAKGAAQFQHFRIDAEHSNSFAAWKKLGSPQQPTAEQYATLESAGQLASLHPAQKIEVKDAAITLGFALPRQAVSLLTVNW